MKTIILFAIATILSCNRLTAQTETGLRAGDKASKYTTNSTTDPFVFNPNLTYGEVKDVDGNVYKTITIGTQTWMAENLKTTHYNDTTAIPMVADETAWKTLTTPAFCWFNNDSVTYKANYGALYDWPAVKSGKLAPAGWHVPSDTEWSTLENYLIANGFNYDGTTTGDRETNNKIAKSMATATNWDADAGIGTVGNTDFPAKRNASGFSVLPGGGRFTYGTFNNINMVGVFWSSSANDGTSAWNRNMFSFHSDFYRVYNYKNCGFSVRCVKDSVSTTDINKIESQGSNTIKLYPNPAINQLEISYKTNEQGCVQLEIIDMHGKVVEKQILNSQKGINNENIPVTHLPAGLYLIRLHSRNKLETIKFIKNLRL
jgi:uncharacterized protein (TIGR02145 family)